MKTAYHPESLSEALEIRANERVKPIAGGTDLMVQHRREGGIAPGFSEPLLFLYQLPELKKITADKNILTIGSGVLLSQLTNDTQVPNLLRETAQQMAAVTTRNVATIGGNVCNASPAADILPCLYLLNAELVLQSLRNYRILPIHEFITGPGTTLLREDELLVEIRFPLDNFEVEKYRKIGTRKAMALSKISFAAGAIFKDSKLSDIRMSLGAVAPTVVRSLSAERLLINKTKQEIEKQLPEVMKAYEKAINPIDDARSNKKYRKQVSLELIQDFIENQILNHKKIS